MLCTPTCRVVSSHPSRNPTTGPLSDRSSLLLGTQKGTPINIRQAGSNLPRSCLSSGLALRRSISPKTKSLTASKDQSQAYNEEMKKAMGWDDADPYQYHYDRGLYYHEVMPNLLCGSQPRNVDDVVKLKENVGASVIVNLQQDKDFQHWGVDFPAVSQKAQELGIHLIRRPAQDFDPHSLRHILPSAVHSVYHALKDAQRVYVHCTAGLGRAPAVCIAYMFWFKDMGLDEAYKDLTDKRPCGPKRDAIRGATFDLCSGRPSHEFDILDSNAFTGMSQPERDTLRHRVITWNC